MTNHYRYSFAAPCPNNGLSVSYELEIVTTWTVMVEDIIAACELAQQASRPYHETIADELYGLFGGMQTIIAFHHGVEIETRRGW